MIVGREIIFVLRLTCSSFCMLIACQYFEVMLCIVRDIALTLVL
jgi:hypothetical protein